MATDNSSEIRVVPSTDRRQWIVVAPWLGQVRTVHGPCDLYEATRVRADLERE
jgi:hypothetical protein